LPEFEGWVGIASIVIVSVGCAKWYPRLWSVNRFAANRAVRLLLAVFPVLCCLVIVSALPFYAAHDVRESLFYTAYYALIGAAWISFSMAVVPLLGISARDDVLERKNIAALWPCMSAMLGSTICYLGSNISSGPGPHAVLASATIATGSLYALWLLFEVVSDHATSEAITIGRDTGAGIRLSGLLLFNGAVLGAGAAGPWHPEKVLIEFASSAWPAVIVTFAAALAERSIKTVRVSRSVLVCAVYVSVAVGYIWVAW
jgi:hypothetical protein